MVAIPNTYKKRSLELNHYTTLPVLLDILKRKKLVLNNPSYWRDKNDSKVIEKYIKRKHNINLFAICFCIGNETIHHWNTYANGISGCCIAFDKNKLVKAIRKVEGIRAEKVNYKRVDEVEINTPDLKQYPFLKRVPYRIEKEFRIIWEGQTNRSSFEIEIDLDYINKITLSPHLPDEVRNTLIELLKEKINDPEKKIVRSSILENKRWIDSFYGGITYKQ